MNERIDPIGLDTGFFVELLRNNHDTVRMWEEIVEGNESAVSCLTLLELERLALKGMIDLEAVNVLLEISLLTRTPTP